MKGPATDLIRDLQARRRSNGHNIVGIQGAPGVGKSTLAISIARNLDPGFGPDRIFYAKEALWGVIGPAAKGGVFILDEGTSIAMNRTWQDRQQIALVELLNTIRQRHHTLIWCAPNLQRLDVVIRDDLLTHKLNCVSRGSARIRTRRLDRDGEPAGWKTWPGYLGWPSLDEHPVWGAYYGGKEDAFRRLVSKGPPKRKDAVEEINQIRERIAAPKDGDVLV